MSPATRWSSLPRSRTRAEAPSGGDRARLLQHLLELAAVVHLRARCRSRPSARRARTAAGRSASSSSALSASRSSGSSKMFTAWKPALHAFSAADGLRREAALREVGRALHEQHGRGRLQVRLDARGDFGLTHRCDPRGEWATFRRLRRRRVVRRRRDAPRRRAAPPTAPAASRRTQPAISSIVR